MKRFFRKSILLLIVALILTSTVLPCYAAKAKKATADTVSTKTEKVELNVSSDSINLVVDKYIILNADVTGVEKQPTISWKSSDPAVAKVDTNGVVTGVSVGRAIITATAEVDGETLESNYKVNVVTSDNFVKNFLEKNQILSYQYSYVDDYYYTNDKKCWQDNFGYARIYDLAAPYIVLEYAYLRVFFTYEDRDFMVQLWKGQYGYVF